MSITDPDTLRFLQNPEDHAFLYSRGISCMLARDLWTLPWDTLMTHAMAFAVTEPVGGRSTIVIYNFDEISKPERYGDDVELTQITYSYAIRWGRTPAREPITNTYVIPGSTAVYLVPRIAGGNQGYIITKEGDAMSHQNSINLKGAPYSNTERAEPPAIVTTDRSMLVNSGERGTYLSLEGPADVWLDRVESLQLISNVTSALGTELHGFELDYDVTRDAEIYVSDVTVNGGEGITIRTDEAITEDEVLAHIKAMSEIYIHLVSKRKTNDELYARVDEFRKKLKPNAKSFTPTKELGDQQRKFQVERFKRVTGWVETELNKDKEDPTA